MTRLGYAGRSRASGVEDLEASVGRADWRGKITQVRMACFVRHEQPACSSQCAATADFAARGHVVGCKLCWSRRIRAS
jgi:hypothetical protein